MTWRTAPLLLATLLALSTFVAADGGDQDADGVADGDDNCPQAPNQDQADMDQDDKGDSCDEDVDGDGAKNGDDACPRSPDKSCQPPAPCPSNGPCNDPAFRDCMARAPRTAEAERECKQEYCSRTHSDYCNQWACREHPQSGACTKGPAEGRECLAKAEREPRSEACQKYCAAHPDDCRAFCEHHPDARVCAFHPKGDERHVAFEALPDGLANLSVRAHLVLASVRMEATEAFHSEHDERTLRVEAGDNRLELHDDASGFLRFEGPTATLTLVFPDGVTHTVGQGPRSGASKVTYPGGGLALVESDSLTWVDEHTLVATDFLAFHIVSGQFDPEGPKDPHVRAKIQEAMEHGDKVGAAIHIGHGDDLEVFAYDRVNVSLKPSKDRPSEADPLEITLSSDLPEGRAFVLHINKTLLDVDAGQLRLRYFDLPEGEDSSVRTEVVFNRATDLDDILDPTDDDGQPEYYVVRDENGLQVMVTVPHWSVHMIQLSALDELVQPSVLVGIAVGAAGVAIAAVALFVPRRRDP